MNKEVIAECLNAILANYELKRDHFLKNEVN